MGNKENKVRRVWSAVLPSGEIIETIYDPKTEETRLVVSKGGKTEILEKYVDLTGKEWYPFSGNHSFLQNKFIRLPSGVVSHGTPLELFKEIDSFVNEYMQTPDDFRTVSVLYVMLTWVFDRFHTIPYLRVVGDFGTGKTRFEQIMSGLCYKATSSGGSITTAAVFRSINMIRGTFIFDEADFKTSEMWSEITKILNSGNVVNSPVARMEVQKDGDMKVRTFDVFGPKILASRERFGDTALESRCLTEQLMPVKNPDRSIHLGQDFGVKAEILRNKLLNFRLDTYHKIQTDEATVQEINSLRLRQSALALTSLAVIVGEEALKNLQTFLKRYEREMQNLYRYDVKADIVLCILIKLQKDPANVPNKIYMQEIKHVFEQQLFEDYSDRNENAITGIRPGGMTIAARKIGVYMRSLGIKTDRDGRGFYIPVPQELPRIQALAERYKFDQAFLDKTDEDKPQPLDQF